GRRFFEIHFGRHTFSRFLGRCLKKYDRDPGNKGEPWIGQSYLSIIFLPCAITKIKLCTMKIFKYAALTVLVFFISCSGTKTATDLPTVLNVFHDPNSKTILVAAHRGAHMGNYENSISSTKQSIRSGVDIVEVDVRTTKDGHLVLMHDSSIDRTT